jgi:hypothetical protein
MSFIPFYKTFDDPAQKSAFSEILKKIMALLSQQNLYINNLTEFKNYCLFLRVLYFIADLVAIFYDCGR